MDYNCQNILHLLNEDWLPVRPAYFFIFNLFIQEGLARGSGPI